MFTIIDLLAVFIIIGIPIGVTIGVTQVFSLGVGLTAGVVAFGVCWLFVSKFYRWFWRWATIRQKIFKERYTSIYRVISLPENKRCVIAKDNEIRIGDYGWEAHPLGDRGSMHHPLREDGLIYLEGLTADWYVVWHAGYQVNQVEYVRKKPLSQYDWREFILSSKEIPCPYPVERENMTLLWRPS